VACNAPYAPRGTPPEIVQRLSAQVAKPPEEREVRQRMLDLGHEPAAGNPARLAAFVHSEW